MAKTVASLSVSINASTRGLQKGMRRAANIVGVFRNDVASLSATLAKIGAGAAVAGVTAVGIGLQRTIASMSDLAKVSDKLSIAPTPLIALRDAAQESGVEIKTFDMGLQRMLRRIQEASKGTGEAKQTLMDLGLNAKALAQMKPEEQFVAIAEAMSKAADEGLDLSRAMKLFDSEGVALINTLRHVNDKGLDHFIEGVKKSGREVSRAELLPSEDIEDRMKRLTDKVAGLFVKLAKAVGPALSGALEKLETFLDSPELLSNVEQAFKAISDEIGKADQHLKSFLKTMSEKAEDVKTFASDVQRITGAIGTVAGGAAATIAHNAEQFIKGKPQDTEMFDRVIDDAVKQLGDVPERIKQSAEELWEGAKQFGRELRDSTMRAVDDLTGKNSGGFIRNNSTGATTGVGNPEAVQELRKINNTLQRGIGFGTNPSALPPGTMLIKVHG